MDWKKLLIVILILICREDCMALNLTSTAFKEGVMIPMEYTCDGQDKSPALMWADAPEGTKSFVLICDDPDAPMGTWDHWILFDIPNTITELEENIQHYPEGIKQGDNSWGRIGYGGPCPPSGTHRYFFKLYALDGMLNLPEGSKKAEIETAMKNHVLDEATLIGKYERNKS